MVSKSFLQCRTFKHAGHLNSPLGMKKYNNNINNNITLILNIILLRHGPHKTVKGGNIFINIDDYFSNLT